MQKNYPVLFNQNNYLQDLGSSKTETIKAGGCFDCCFAMKACYYNHRTDPVQLNQAFLQQNVYVDTDLLPDNGLTKIYSDVSYVQTIDYEPVPTDILHLQQLLTDPKTTITLRIRFASGGFHFVELVSADGNAKVLHIANPETGQIEDFSKYYGNAVTANLHAIVYSGPAPDAAPDLSQPSLAQSFRNAVTKATNFDAVCSFLGIANAEAIQPGTGQVVIEKIKYLQNELESVHKQLSDAQTKLMAASSTQSPPVTAATQSQVDTAVSDIITQPAFQNGQVAVSGTQAPTPPNGNQAALSPSPQAGIVTPVEFIKAVFRLLFV